MHQTVHAVCPQSALAVRASVRMRESVRRAPYRVILEAVFLATAAPPAILCSRPAASERMGPVTQALSIACLNDESWEPSLPGDGSAAVDGVSAAFVVAIEALVGVLQSEVSQG
jgi:hypothetical protein